MFHLIQTSLALTRLTLSLSLCIRVRSWLVQKKLRFSSILLFLPSLDIYFFLLRLSIHSIFLSLFFLRYFFLLYSFDSISPLLFFLFFLFFFTFKCFVRTNFNENRVITSQVQKKQKVKRMPGARRRNEWEIRAAYATRHLQFPRNRRIFHPPFSISLFKNWIQFIF